MKKVVTIVGPTASGKTSLSIKLAKKFNAEIINGDSVQIYKELNIGSAKIKSAEMENIKHHLFDVVSVNDNFSVFNYQKLVREKLNEINKPFIVGGTGLYIKAALFDYEFNEPGRDKTLELELANLTNEKIYEKLLKLDPNIKLEVNNRRRLIRAYEQAKYGELRSEKIKKDNELYNILTIYLDLDRKELEKRLIERLDKQLADGFIEEVRSINKPINAIGYRELYQHINNEYTLDEAKEKIITASKRLAKKQKTWFKNQMHAHILDALSPTLYEDACKLIEGFL